MLKLLRLSAAAFALAALFAVPTYADLQKDLVAAGNRPIGRVMDPKGAGLPPSAEGYHVVLSPDGRIFAVGRLGQCWVYLRPDAWRNPASVQNLASVSYGAVEDPMDYRTNGVMASALNRTQTQGRIITNDSTLDVSKYLNPSSRGDPAEASEQCPDSDGENCKPNRSPRLPPAVPDIPDLPSINLGQLAVPLAILAGGVFLLLKHRRS